MLKQGARETAGTVYAQLCESLSRVRLFVTPWTVACQAPPSTGFPRQEYWSGLLCPSPGHLSDPGIEPESLMSPALADGLLLLLLFLPLVPPGKPPMKLKDTCSLEEKL